MKTILPLFLIIFFPIILGAQTCPDTVDYEFYSQEDIDDWFEKYPDCTILNGDLYIDHQYSALTNLHAFRNIRTITGSLSINAPYLYHLNGLQNLDTVKGSINIYFDNFKNIDSITNISYLGGNLVLDLPDKLSSLPVFHNLDTIHGYLDISPSFYAEKIPSFPKLRYVNGDVNVSSGNSSDLTGLDSLNHIGGDLSIARNNNLVSVHGLEQLHNVQGTIRIHHNNALQTIDALNDLTIASLQGLEIHENPSLSICNTTMVCSAFTGGIKPRIFENGEGCQTFFEVYTACEISEPCIQNLVFTSQAEIDAFPQKFPDCQIISGNVVIRDETASITNLDSLFNILEIQGSLEIVDAPQLKSFKGITNLNTIGANLYLDNLPQLENMQGLENIEFIPGDLTLIYLPIPNLSELVNLKEIGGDFLLQQLPITNFAGLTQLTQIGGSLIVIGLDITSVDGLENLQNVSEEINISYNDNLSSINSFTALASVGGIEISSNANLTEILSFSAIDSVGNLKILNHPLLSNITGLEHITKVTTYLTFAQNASLTTLENFAFSDPIGGISISSNPLLQNIDCFSDLTYIHGGLGIANNPLLPDLLPFSEVKGIEGSLSVSGNIRLKNLHGLESVDHVNGLFISNQDSLISLAGLSSLDTIHLDLQITHCAQLQNLDGLQELSVIKRIFKLEYLPAFQAPLHVQQLQTIGYVFTVERCGIRSFTGMENLVHGGSYFSIQHNDSLITLAGLESLTHIGQLTISDNGRLSNLEALSNLHDIDGDFIYRAGSVQDTFPFFSSLTRINGYLQLLNSQISDMTCFPALSYIDGPMYINSCNRLTNLNGLENLTYINGSLSIKYNDALSNIDGLINLQEIDGAIEIVDNDKLLSIDGLDAIDPNSIIETPTLPAVYIVGNEILTSCATASICNLILGQQKKVTLVNNATGCNNEMQIIARCASGASCGIDIIKFERQSQIDSFPLNYPGCEFVKGHVVIKESSPGDIVNLDSLTQLRIVAASLQIHDNINLTSLDGLDSLKYVGGTLLIVRNKELQDIYALENLNGKFINNNLLSPHYVRIEDNPNLHLCSTHPICDLFTIPNIQYTLFGNGDFCNSPADIIEHCNLPVTCELEYEFYSQKSVNEFAIKFPKCTEVISNLYVSSFNPDPVTDLTPFKNIRKIHGNLRVSNNHELESLTGLDSIVEVKGSLTISNNALLPSLHALQNINPHLIWSLDDRALDIRHNPLLTDCGYENICIMLGIDTLDTRILGNGTDCNTEEEILHQCLVSTKDVTLPELHIYPNPTTGQLYFIMPHASGFSPDKIMISNMSGQTEYVSEYMSSISLEHLIPGMYVVMVMRENRILYRSRIIIAR